MQDIQSFIHSNIYSINHFRFCTTIKKVEDDDDDDDDDDVA